MHAKDSVENRDSPGAGLPIQVILQDVLNGGRVPLAAKRRSHAGIIQGSSDLPKAYPLAFLSVA
jgi:hypothetical protein